LGMIKRLLSLFKLDTEEDWDDWDWDDESWEEEWDEEEEEI